MSNIALIARIEQRKSVLEKIKMGLIERLNLYQKVSQIDDDTPLFGSGLKLDSVDATEVVVLLDEIFGIRVTEGDDPSYMRSVNTLTSFVIAKQGETTNGSATGADKE
ncbi:acyl carrier protein [Serratia fonticola]|uniref:acyl carrier protein n=1 Tax=Serratia fonticola TaxID=47917 RepID=UPI002178B370|nr:phosphopantetheine-binding protein [Serratia fonticola]CAI1614855.1 acyl carrier protein [Serratia fonticola]CAI1885298.1 acyl carrier protein [Serratia fonticola]CAI1947021.1 acyl carrier protein [Serratia fonticola]